MTDTVDINVREAEIEDLRAELEAAMAEIERKMGAGQFVLEQLAAEQAKNVELREALENHSGNYKLSKEECTKINALLDAPSDTSALEAIVKKAGEVMRERCLALREAHLVRSEAIRALPAVTLEDLK